MLLFGQALLLIVFLVHGPGTVPNNASSGLPLFFLCDEIDNFFKGSVCLYVYEKVYKDLWVCDASNKVVFDDFTAVVKGV